MAFTSLQSQRKLYKYRQLTGAIIAISPQGRTVFARLLLVLLTHAGEHSSPVHSYFAFATDIETANR